MDETLLQKTFGRIGELFKIHDYLHADYLMKSLLTRWNIETQDHHLFPSYSRKIESGLEEKLQRSKPSNHLISFITSGPTEEVEKNMKKMIRRVKRMYGRCEDGNGQSKYFNYLIIDLKTLRKKKTGPNDPPEFLTFLKSVLYIGKGCGQRPRDHGQEALDVPVDDLRFHSRKIQRIRRILDTQKAIGIVRTNIRSREKEALAYECSMICAMGFAALTNVREEKMPKPENDSGDESYEDEEKEERESPLWTQAEIEVIGVDRLVDAWRSPVVEVTLETIMNRLPIWLDDEEVEKEGEEEEETVKRKGPDAQQKERQARKKKREEREEEREERKKKQEAARKARKEKNRKRLSEELKRGRVGATQKEQDRKRQRPPRQFPAAENKKKKH